MPSSSLYAGMTTETWRGSAIWARRRAHLPLARASAPREGALSPRTHPHWRRVVLSASSRAAQLQLAHPVEQVLEQLAVAGDQVGHHAPLQRLEAEDQQQHRERGG